MTKDRIIDEMKRALEKVTEQSASDQVVSEDTLLREGLGLDSFAALELLFELEEAMDVSIPQDAAAGFKTVGDVVNFVLTQHASAARPVAGSAAP
ncbi:MAG: acyl carrier protein [Myxococcales bacterium]|nr:acyl carrier protein [Myxococcales bacterium]